MLKRDRIQMSQSEIDQYLESERTLNVATVSPDGQIHLVAMWFVLEDSCPVFTTYGRSQKIMNLRRDSRLTVLVESGSEYSRLRGVELVGQGEIIEDWDEILRIGQRLDEKYADGGPKADVARAMAKRVAVKLHVERAVSWDHSKLADGTH